MPRKEFEAFTRLDASDVNTFLMDQTIQSFAGTAARGSAIPSPVEGMYAHLEDTDDLQFYDGAAWRSQLGTVFLTEATAAASTELNVNNVFSAKFQNYVVYYNVTGTAGAQFGIRLRASAVDATTGYAVQLVEIGGTSVSASRATSSPASIGTLRSSGRSFGTIQLSNPFAALETSYTAINQDPASGATLQIRAGSNSNATSYDGITFIPGAGNFTGTIRFYGVKQ
jgi:hypothetical protein